MDLSSPSSTLRSLTAATRAGDWNAILACYCSADRREIAQYTEQDRRLTIKVMQQELKAEGPPTLGERIRNEPTFQAFKTDDNPICFRLESGKWLIQLVPASEFKNGEGR